ncbi:MAG: cytochrome ubiquinol oxidase subunit I, partial [Paramuribaculum sp.]|nr:cytochrome ubiquinol oxidase subunit I [Paramuribaculum sp.]
WVAILSIAVVWICSEAGWITAEVGRQPWIIQDIMPASAAISDITVSSVVTTFWMFAVVFTGLLAAEMCIMVKRIRQGFDTPAVKK